MIPERKVFLLDRCELLLDLLLEYTNLAEINDDIHNVPELAGYDNSELNCLDCIGRMENPNVTSIAEAMNMTKGAISKIIRKLSDKGTLADYQLDGNRQKVYYTLSDKGKALFAAHEARHNQWHEREIAFFRTLSEADREGAIRFLNAYIHELNERTSPSPSDGSMSLGK